MMTEAETVMLGGISMEVLVIPGKGREKSRNGASASLLALVLIDEGEFSSWVTRFF